MGFRAASWNYNEHIADDITLMEAAGDAHIASDSLAEPIYSDGCRLVEELLSLSNSPRGGRTTMREIIVWAHDDDFFHSWGDIDNLDEFATIDAFNEAMEEALVAAYPGAMVTYHSDMDVGPMDVCDTAGDERGVLATISAIANMLWNACDSWTVKIGPAIGRRTGRGEAQEEVMRSTHSQPDSD